MTKKELYRIADKEENCKEGCKGCNPENPRKRCEFSGKECRGCAGMDKDCKTPDKEETKKVLLHDEELELEDGDREVVSVSVIKTDFGYYVPIEIDDDLSKKELVHILRDVLGIRV